MSVTVLYSFYFAYSMFSVIDELCMPAYIKVRIFHWIMLSIMVDEGKVDIIDPLYKEQELYESIINML